MYYKFVNYYVTFKKETKSISFSLKSVEVYLQVYFTKSRKEQTKSPRDLFHNEIYGRRAVSPGWLSFSFLICYYSISFF